MNNASIDEADFKKGDAMSPGLSPPQMPGHNGHPPRLSRSLPDRRGSSWAADAIRTPLTSCNSDTNQLEFLNSNDGNGLWRLTWIRPDPVDARRRTWS